MNYRDIISMRYFSYNRDSAKEYSHLSLEDEIGIEYWREDFMVEDHVSKRSNGNIFK